MATLWDMSLGDIAKKMKEDGYDLSSMTTTEKVEAFMGYVTTAQVDITTAETEASAEAILAAKKVLYMQKQEEFFNRTQERFIVLAAENGTYNLAQFMTLMYQAADAVKAEMIAEMS